MIIQSKTGVVHEGSSYVTKCGISLKTPPTILKDVSNIPDTKFCRKCFQNGKHDATKLMEFFK